MNLRNLVTRAGCRTSDKVTKKATWTARRKASVVAAVLSGMITIEEVCRRYDLSVDEFLSWHNAMQRHGLPGLCISKLQNYRYSRPKRD